MKNQIKESFTPQQLELLKKEYSSLSKIDPASPSAKALIALLDKIPQPDLLALAKANIKFVSKLAVNRLSPENRKLALGESVSSKKSLNRFLKEATNGTKLEPKIRNQIINSFRLKGLDGNHKFNSMGEARREIEKILNQNGIHFANGDNGWSRLLTKDNDTVGTKNRGNIDLVFEVNAVPVFNKLVITWEHLESGYEVIIYFS